MTGKLVKPYLAVWLAVALLFGCSTSEPVAVQTIAGYAMGTSYSVKIVSTKTDSQQLQLGVESVLADVNRRMSTYLTSSELSIFSQADINKKISVSHDTALVVSKALDVAKQTTGYFDPTVEPLVDLWGFGPTPRNDVVPTESQIQGAREQVGFAAVEVNLDENYLLKSADRSLDLSSIAKGHAVDLVANYLESKGFSDYLVEVGGEMRFSGMKPDSQHWRIAIEKPDPNERSAYRVIEITDGAIATSGDYRNFFEIQGVRYSHTINPFTGYPVDHDLASVTVVMPECMQADAYATGFMAMGREQAFAMAQAMEIAAFFIYKEDGKFISVQTTQFTDLFGN